MSAHRIELCSLNELPAKGCRSFDLQHAGQEISLFIVHQQGQLYAYHNMCPHRGIRLEWLPDQFLDIDGHFIQCATHGALFQPDSGLCIAGPCSGQSLTAIPVEIRDGIIGVLLPETA